MSKIYVIHENAQWTAPLITQLDALGVPNQDWFLDRGRLDLSVAPPQGVFYNRMSASSHTRDHRYAAEYTATVLSWLEQHGRHVINNSRALQLEISKTAQYTALAVEGILVPRTVAAIGTPEIMAAADHFSAPFIVKHNRGGKGLGVHLFRDRQELRAYLDGPEFEQPVDGITLVQEYIESSAPYITRCEFVGGEFLYAVRVDNTRGFHLCPADECDTGTTFCSAESPPVSKFHIVRDLVHPIVKDYQRFLRNNGIHIAGIEFIVNRRGEIYTYDVNTNTNYNPGAEESAGLSGMAAIARYLQRQLETTNTAQLRKKADDFLWQTGEV